MKLLEDHSKPEQVALRTQVCAEASDDNINYYLRVCHAKGVDPFSGLLYMQLRNNKGKIKAGIQATIDGARTAAARSGHYAGSEEPEFDSEENETPKWCRVTVYRMVKDERCAFTARCRYREFVPQAPNDFQWRSKPYHMISKVTEMQALRKAFPELVSGANEDDYEIEVETDVPTPAHNDKAKITVEWSNAINAFAKLNKSEADLLAHLGVTKADLTVDHMEILRNWYEELQRGQTP